MSRKKLPNRRATLTTSIPFGGTRLHVSYGCYADGRLGELFISGPKVGSDQRTAALEATIAASFALQHGAAAQDILAALPLGHDGQPEGILGTLLARWLDLANELVDSGVPG